MKTLRDILRREPVWVNPAHRVESVIGLMRWHKLSGLPVLDGTSLVGMALSEDLLGVDGKKSVMEVMDRRVVFALPALSIREAAELMTRENLMYLPVITSEGTLLGAVTSSDLLAELRRSFDPITELPGLDSLREWSVDKLRAGHEITLIFFDINDFGLFNKKFDQVVGDSVLKSVANVLRDSTDPLKDMVSRVGGDEFCIGSLRWMGEAEALAEVIQENIEQMKLTEARGQSVSLSVGISGGKRTREREQVHYDATFNNLIKIASRICYERKAARNEGKFTQESGEALGGEATVALDTPTDLEARPTSLPETHVETSDVPVPSIETSIPAGEPIRLARLDVSYRERTATARVLLEVEVAQGNLRQSAAGTSAILAEVSRLSTQEEIPRLVAEATLSAARNALPAEYDLRLTDVSIVSGEDGISFIRVSGLFIVHESIRQMDAVEPYDADIYPTVANATLRAINEALMRQELLLTRADSSD